MDNRTGVVTEATMRGLTTIANKNDAVKASFEMLNNEEAAFLLGKKDVPCVITVDFSPEGKAAFDKQRELDFGKAKED